MRIKKIIKFSIFLLLIFTFTIANSKTIEENKAKEVATKFYCMQKRISSSPTIIADKVYQSDIVLNGTIVPGFYIFNINNAFVIVAAQDEVQPILGYSMNGNFNTEDITLPFFDLLQLYENEIQQILEDQSLKSEQTSLKWEMLLKMNQAYISKNATSVNPLLTTTWNQDYPYNYYCPQDNEGPGGKVYAGCVATCMAQIMNYWEYPSSGIGSHSYSSNYGNLSVNFANTTYNFDLMPDNLTTASSQESIEAVATLIYQCGVSVDMNYSPIESSSYSVDAAKSFRQYFGYTSSTYIEKSNYSNSDWNNLIKTEIDNGRLVLYGGNGSAGGHAFILDGYDASELFHINWGWSGAYDGYFSLSLLNPGSYNFSDNQTAIIHIEPNINCNPPTNVLATVDEDDVQITWTAVDQGEWMTWSNEISGISVGTGESSEFDVAQRFETSDLTDLNGKVITLVKFVPSEASCTYSIRIWTGGTEIAGPSILVVDQPVITSELFLGQWNEVVLNTPVIINSNQELWIGYHCNTTTGNPAGCDEGPQVAGKGNMIKVNDSWMKLTELSSTLTYNWAIKAYATTASKDIQAVTYRLFRNGSLIANDLSTLFYKDRNLESGTYCYSVRTVCSDGESAPSSESCITIDESDCFVPTNLTATSENGSVSLEWDAPVTERDELFYENFENGIPENWTNIDNDGDGYFWVLDSSGLSSPHTGNYYVESASYLVYGGALNPDNWLITPSISINNSYLVYWVSAKDEDWTDEHYGVYISTTGTDVSDFTLLYEETISSKNGSAKGDRNTYTQGDWYRRVIDLTDYSGNVYLAFRHFNSTDMFMLLLDDVIVTNSVVENSYIVYRNNSRIAATTESSYTDNELPDGNYCYTVKQACENNKESAHSNQVCQEVSINEMEQLFKVYPNPTDNQLIIIGENMERIYLYNALGQLLIDKNISGSHEVIINTTQLKSGLYILNILTTEGKNVSKRVIVTH